MAVIPLVSPSATVVVRNRTPGGRTSRTGPAPAAMRGAVTVMGTRPHLTQPERPKVKCCRKCKGAPLYNPDPALEPPAWFADGLSSSLLWNV